MTHEELLLNEVKDHVAKNKNGKYFDWDQFFHEALYCDIQDALDKEVPLLYANRRVQEYQKWIRENVTKYRVSHELWFTSWDQIIGFTEDEIFEMFNSYMQEEV